MGLSYGYGAAYYGAWSSINWDSNDPSHILDGNTSTVYGATVSAVNGQAQFGVILQIAFYEDGVPVDLDGYFRVLGYTWGSPAIASGICGWGYIDDENVLHIVESFGSLYGDVNKQLFLHGRSNYAIVLCATGTSSIMSGATAKFKEVQIESLSYGLKPPVAAFDAHPREGEAPCLVAFANQSERASSVSWDLGAGVTSTEWEPWVLYSNAGIYPVTLTVSNYAGTDSITKDEFITVWEPCVVQNTRRRRYQRMTQID